MEKLNNATLIFRDRSYITYSIPKTPRYTIDEVDFWFVTSDERLLICKDSFAEIVSRGDYVFNRTLTSLQTSDNLDKIARLYSKTFLTNHHYDVDFDRYIFLDGVGYTTWISFIENTMNFYLRIDRVVASKKHTNIFFSFVDKTELTSWWNRVKLELHHLL